MKIGIIGTGNMGRILGSAWALQGHEVFFGARDIAVAGEAAARATSLGAPHALAGSNREAAMFGDVVFYSPRSVSPVEVIGDVGILDGKVVIDPNNWAIPAGGFEFVTIQESLAERLQGLLPRARVVKAFNTMAQELFEQPLEALRAHGVAAFLASDHDSARETVASLARDLGLVPIDIGPLRNARIAESLGDLIRYLILGAKLGPYATLKVDVMPAMDTGRFGGRRPSAWWRANAGQADDADMAGSLDE